MKICYKCELLKDESLFFKNNRKDGLSDWVEWHIDHIIPISSFKKETPMLRVNSLDNLQPLCAIDNLQKSNKY